MSPSTAVLLAGLGLLFAAGAADARPLTTNQMLKAVARGRDAEARLGLAARRFIAEGRLRDGAVGSGHEVVAERSSAGVPVLFRIFKKGQAGKPYADHAVVVAATGEITSVHTHHTRRERGGDTTLTLSFSPESTLAAGHGPGGIIMLESGLRSNGDTAGARHMMRGYEWDPARGITQVTTWVSEDDGSFRRPLANGRVKDVRDERRLNHTSYVAHPQGTPVGPHDGAGMSRYGRDADGAFRNEKVR